MPKISVKKAHLQENKTQIESLVASGMTFREIGEMFGCSHTLVQYVLHPERERRGEKRRYVSAAKRNRKKNAETTGVSPSLYIGKPEKIEVLGELPPPDTRDLTGRIFGDPVYQRSALYKLRQREGA